MSNNTTHPPHKIKTLTLSFNHPIRPYQITRWRGAFIEMAGWEDDLFHNHVGADGYQYRYPQVHYRVRRGNAALFAINEGVGALQKVLASSDWRINWDGETRPLQIEDLRMNEHELAFCERPKNYRLFKWMALNPANYEKYRACPSMVQRVQLLERLLRNHLMAALWGFGWEPQGRVEVNILDINRMQPLPFHGVRTIAFDISYSANVSLPDGMAIGKGVSHGFGWQFGARQKNNGHFKSPRTNMHFEQIQPVLGQ